ncbi:MAG: STT3 domain-containing protein [Nanoarchaeota archaeon]|nr:STT3 domain-containing protein [Nanoarchaeota archaeon]
MGDESVITSSTPSPEPTPSHASEPKPKFDWQAFFQSRKWMLLILIPIIVAIVVRLEPMNLAPLDRAAENNVLNYYNSQIESQIRQQNPTLPDAQVAQAVQQQVSQIPKAQLESQIKATAAEMKGRLQYTSGDSTYAYIGDIDSYYWLRQARNIVEKGDQCDLRKDGQCFDTYTTAPIPRLKEIDYYPKVIVAVYRFLKVFQPDMTLMQASFLTPLVLSILLTFPLFFLIRKIGGNIAAVIGTILLNVNPMVLSRSLGSDSDIANVFFQAFFLWLAVEFFYAKDAKKRYLWAAGVGIELSIYALFWTGWWYLLDLFIAALAFQFVYTLTKKWMASKSLEGWQASVKESALAFLAMIVPLIILQGFVFFSIPALWSTVTDQFGVLNFKVAANANLWPNVLTTVAEFNNIGLGSVLGSFGTFSIFPFFLLAMFGILSLLFPSKQFIRKHLFLFIGLVLFDVFLYQQLNKGAGTVAIFLIMLPLLIALYAHLKSESDEEFHPGAVLLLASIITLVTFFSLRGVRFMFLMAIPVAILASLFLARFTTFLTSFLKRWGTPKIFSTLLTVLLVIWFVSAQFKSGYATAQNYMPMVTDEWVDSLHAIRDNSQPDAIINSWWDFGHWFKYWADRRVTLDGSSQNSPQLHWLGKLLLTSDERLSIGILRMLDCGGNEAFNTLNRKFGDTPHSVDLLNKMMVVNRAQAETMLLKEGFTQSEAEEALQYSHCDAPENFLITSQDMIGKGGVWAHFGSWDFNKAYIQANLNKPEAYIVQNLSDEGMPEARVKQLIKEARALRDEGEINSWIAPWPSFYSFYQPCQKTENETLCGINQGGQSIIVHVDFDKKQGYVVDAQGKHISVRTAFVENNTFTLTGEPAINVGVVAVKEGDSVSALFMSPELTGSMFVRLFFFDGAGMTGFEKFRDTTDLYGTRIITWKVVWPE